MTTVKKTTIDFSEGPEADNHALVAVYGSLREGLHNHSALEMADEEQLGMFETPPVYDMYAVSESFPGLKEDGSTSIKMEVYQVTEEKLKDLNSLEGYYGDDAATNLYNRIKIDTPWGKAYTYIYNYSVGKSPLVESGDWTEYYKMRTIANH
jgi:gamma-glutamylcyclotransferase (GGCT)/AIG2-like uncharacterized protein YtfP